MTRRLKVTGGRASAPRGSYGAAITYNSVIRLGSKRDCKLPSALLTYPDCFVPSTTLASKYSMCCRADLLSVGLLKMCCEYGM